MICINCKHKVNLLDEIYGVIRCLNCHSAYLVVETIPIMINETNDFYNYNHKLKRLVDLKNEKN